MHKDSNKTFSAKYNSWHFISFTHQLVALETSARNKHPTTMDFESSQELESEDLPDSYPTVLASTLNSLWDCYFLYIYI